MRQAARLVMGAVLISVCVGIAVPFASAGFVHPHGLWMSTYPQQPLVFWANGDLPIGFVLFSAPPWYFEETGGLDHWNTVTMTFTLFATTIQGGENPLCFNEGHLDRNGRCVYTVTWTNVTMSQDENGAVYGTYLTTTVTFHIDQNTATGYYLLYMSGEARSGDVVFQGWDQAGVSVRPGHIPCCSWP